MLLPIYYDSTTVYLTCTMGLGFTQGRTDSLWYNSLATNPDMSHAKSLAYIDTIMNYLNPRVNYCMHTVGVTEQDALKKALSVYPNPASDYITLKMEDASAPIRYVRLYDLAGRLVRSVDQLNARDLRIDLHSLSAGSYLLKAGFASGEVTRPVTVQ